MGVAACSAPARPARARPRPSRGSRPGAMPVRLATRKMWVSTAIVGSPKAMLRTTLAVLRPTPGSASSASRVARHLAAMLGDELLRQRDDVLRLGAVEADGADEVGDRRLAERRHLLRRVGEREERRRRLVDAGVGRLRREHDGDEQGERVVVVEFALRLGLALGEAAEDFLDVLRGMRAAARPARRAGLRRRPSSSVGSLREMATRRSTTMRDGDADADQDQPDQEVADRAPVARQLEAARIEQRGERDHLEDDADDERHDAEEVLEPHGSGFDAQAVRKASEKPMRTPMMVTLPLRNDDFDPLRLALDSALMLRPAPADGFAVAPLYSAAMTSGNAACRRRRAADLLGAC